eukprot:TRINITY_DN32864_c0_g1_i1.p1 TRINITY_DN32864_c0_g1~~TRINITY_DN32864_c0_g1_i1.p1  ORF type:complete len:387 (-),score=82.68 TRINITY_DN32864_c0_g1_i1:243-1403(-)
MAMAMAAEEAVAAVSAASRFGAAGAAGAEFVENAAEEDRFWSRLGDLRERARRLEQPPAASVQVRSALEERGEEPLNPPAASTPRGEAAVELQPAASTIAVPCSSGVRKLFQSFANVFGKWLIGDADAERERLRQQLGALEAQLQRLEDAASTNLSAPREKQAPPSATAQSTEATTAAAEEGGGCDLRQTPSSASSTSSSFASPVRQPPRQAAAANEAIDRLLPPMPQTLEAVAEEVMPSCPSGPAPSERKIVVQSPEKSPEKASRETTDEPPLSPSLPPLPAATRSVSLSQEAVGEATSPSALPEPASKPRRQLGRAKSAPEPPVNGLGDQKVCCVCMELPREYAFTPCGHRCVCRLCGTKAVHTDRRCPICRATAGRVLRILDP